MAIKTNLTNLKSRREIYKKTIRLLSGGFTDRKAFPEGKITVFPWDSNIDSWLTDRLKKAHKNKVLWDLVERLCDLNGCSIGKFTVGDAYTVLLVSRAIRYDNVIEYRATCPACQNEDTDRINVPDDLEKCGEKPDDYKGTDTIILPDSKDAIEIRPLLVEDELAVENRTEDQRNTINDRLAHVLLPIVSIGGPDGIPDSITELLQWYNALSPKDASELERLQNEINPHLNTEITHECNKCQKRYTHTLSFDQEFFRAGGPPKS